MRLFWSRNAEIDHPPGHPTEEGKGQGVAEEEEEEEGTKLSVNGAVDLHALQVAEALAVVRGTLLVFALQGTGAPETFDLIPGRGSHSEGNKALIRPKVMAWLQEKGFQAALDEVGGTITVTF